jgi:hypothetical protein
MRQVTSSEFLEIGGPIASSLSGSIASKRLGVLSKPDLIIERRLNILLPFC